MRKRERMLFLPRVVLAKGWEALGAYTRIGDCTVVIQRAGDWLEKGQILRTVYWGVWNEYSERYGGAQSWGAAVKAATWWAKSLTVTGAVCRGVPDAELPPAPRRRAPKAWKPTRPR